MTHNIRAAVARRLSVGIMLLAAMMLGTPVAEAQTPTEIVVSGAVFEPTPVAVLPFQTDSPALAQVANDMVGVIEADLERFVCMDKGTFVGREALERIRRKGVALKLVYLDVDALDADCMGGEPIHANGRVVGVTTSGGFGHRIQKSLAFAYVEPEFAKVGTSIEVEVLENRRRAKVLENEPAYDPANERLRA